MSKFLAGLALFMAGFMVWVVFSVIGAVGEATDGERNTAVMAIVYGAFLVMLGGPFLFWVVAPVASLWTRRP